MEASVLQFGLLAVSTLVFASVTCLLTRRRPLWWLQLLTAGAVGAALAVALLRVGDGTWWKLSCLCALTAAQWAGFEAARRRPAAAGRRP